MTAVRHTLGLLRAFASLGIDKIDIAALRYIGTPDEKMIPGDMMDLADSNGVRKRLAWLGHENAEGAQILCRPEASAAWPVVFLDDIPLKSARGIARKYQSIVVETSPSNCQVWIMTSKPLSVGERKAVQSALAAKMEADFGSISGDHFGRLPGYRNRKPGRNNCWTNLVVVTIRKEGATLDPAPYLISSPEGGVCTRAECPGEAVFGPTLILGNRPRTRGGSESEAECSFAKHSLAHGRSKEWVIANIAARAKARGKRKTDAEAEEYARRTVEKATSYLAGT